MKKFIFSSAALIFTLGMFANAHPGPLEKRHQPLDGSTHCAKHTYGEKKEKRKKKKMERKRRDHGKTKADQRQSNGVPCTSMKKQHHY